MILTIRHSLQDFYLFLLDHYGRHSAIIVFALFGAFLLVVVNVAHNNRHGNGIIDGPGGASVYLQGEACTVNFDYDRDVFEKRIAWCLEQYGKDPAAQMQE